MEGGNSPHKIASAKPQTLLDSLKGRVQDRLFERIGPQEDR